LAKNGFEKQVVQHTTTHGKKLYDNVICDD